MHIQEIKKALKAPLPGDEAHLSMMSYKRSAATEARKLNPQPRISAVMMLLFPGEIELETLFILRPDKQGVHSAQMSFPGGKTEEEDHDLLDTALRETFEEVGIDPSIIEPIGQLSEIYIPPSNFIVHPFIGWIDRTPILKANPDEVNEIIRVPITHFLKEPIIQSKQIFLPSYNVHIDAPYFDVKGNTLWGATAMMIQEFRFLFGYSK